MTWLGLFAVFFFGFCFGIFVAGLLVAAKDPVEHSAVMKPEADQHNCRDRLTCKKHGGYISDSTLERMGYVKSDPFTSVPAGFGRPPTGGNK